MAANALMGVHRALLDSTRRRVLAGSRGTSLAAAVRSPAERALARLERGLGDYAIKPPPEGLCCRDWLSCSRANSRQASAAPSQVVKPEVTADADPQPPPFDHRPAGVLPRLLHHPHLHHLLRPGLGVLGPAGAPHRLWHALWRPPAAGLAPFPRPPLLLSSPLVGRPARPGPAGPHLRPASP